MLDHTPAKLIHEHRTESSDENALGEVDFVSFLQAYRWTIASTILVFVVLAGIYVQQTTVLYQARAEIIIDPRMPQIPTREQNAELASSMDAALVESQMVVMRSEKIATSVIETLRLDEIEAQPGWRARLRQFAMHLLGEPDPPPPTPYERLRDAVAMIESGLSVRRIGTSYAFEIAFTSPVAERSAQIVNAIADAYVRDQLDSRSESARQGSEWLEGRIQKLRRDMNAASRLVQEFRANHDYRIHNRKPLDAEGGARPQEEARDADEPITLEELESASQTSRRIYESFLQAFAEAVQRQSFPLAGARIITQATRPLKPSHPRAVLILALAILLGGLAGVGIAILRRSRDTSIRSPRQMSAARGAGAVELPLIGPSANEPRHVQKQRQRAGAAHVEAILAPFSPFSDELRRVKTIAMLGKLPNAAQTIGVVSTTEGEGRSTIASNLAVQFALSGSRALLVDADIRDGALTRRFAPAATTGLLELLLEDHRVADVVGRTEVPGLDVLPAPMRSLIAHSGDLLGSERMRNVLEEARGTYDVVVLDLPPTQAVADALIIGPMLDGVVAVARSGTTHRRAFAELLVYLEVAQTNILATVLNMAPRRTRRGRSPLPSALIEQWQMQPKT